jgi:hypothetical protein
MTRGKAHGFPWGGVAATKRFGIGIEAVNDAGKQVPWPRFEADEIARLFGILK